MSHFTRIRTRLHNLDTLQKALEDLGYTVEHGGVARGYGTQTQAADLVIRTGSQYDIGFRSEGGQVMMVADLWGLKIDREKFLSEVTQRYAYITVLEQAAARGWHSVNEEVQEDGSIRLVMQRWGE